MKKSFILIAFIAVFLVGQIPAVRGGFAKGLGFVAPTVTSTGGVYNPQLGEIVYDQGSGEFKGLTNDSPITWTAFNSTAVIPTGAILPYVGTTAPAGFELCNGAALSRAIYVDLYAVIGDSFGEGDGSTTFNLPDLRGKFLRGWDNSAGNDPDAASRTACNAGGSSGDNIGSCQNDDSKSHTHFTVINTEGISGYPPNVNRPKNVSINYIIKL